MAWIKRNLFFVTGAVVALALIGVGAWFLDTEYNAEGGDATKIAQIYDDWNKLNSSPDQPGKAGTDKDNVQAAKEQEAALTNWIASIRATFQPLKLDAGGGDFPAQLDRVVGQLQREASDGGVSVTKNYYFSFQAQKNMLGNPSGKLLGGLEARLAEVKTICELLFQAKISSFDYIHREMLEGETNGQDYLPANQKTVDSPLAQTTPYEVSFRCFSGELASALGNLAASPHGLVVKAINVEPVTAAPKSVPSPNARGPVPFLSQSQLRVTLVIEVVKPGTGG